MVIYLDLKYFWYLIIIKQIQ